MSLYPTAVTPGQYLPGDRLGIAVSHRTGFSGSAELVCVNIPVNHSTVCISFIYNDPSFPILVCDDTTRAVISPGFNNLTYPWQWIAIQVHREDILSLFFRLLSKTRHFVMDLIVFSLELNLRFLDEANSWQILTMA